MNKSIEEVKQSISQKYLGKVGIHAVGVHHKTNSLYIYFDSESDQQKDILEKIKKEVEPFELVLIKKERAGFL